jgi:electron transfer flavoprotein alpha subunit
MGMTLMEENAGAEIWVFGDLRNKRLFGSCLNVLAKARQLAESMSGKAAVVLMGSSADAKGDNTHRGQASLSVATAAEECIAHGADYVYILENENLVIPRADTYAVVLANAVLRWGPKLVLFPVTDFGRDLAARSARISNTGLISQCMDLRVEGETVVAKCHSYNGDIMADITYSDGYKTGFATVQPNAFQAVDVKGEPGAVKWVRVDPFDMPERINLLSSLEETDKHQQLENADVVVVGGAGLHSHDNFSLVRELAAVLGGEVGATRPPVFQHWVEEERLIGQTGKTVQPDLLFSIGTSGAVQYTAGITEAKTIVAINRDKNSPIFQVANFGIVGDAKTFLPLLISKIKQEAFRKISDVKQGDVRAENGNGFGKSVLKLRVSQNYSQEALAQATGETQEFIEKVENEEITPPVSFLLRLAGALNVDAGQFFPKEEKTMARNLRSQALVKRTLNYSYKTLGPVMENDHIRAFMVTIEPKQAHKPVAYKHEGEEFLFVMEGDLRLTLGNKIHHLKSGESIHFNSDVPHKLKSISNEETRCLAVLYTP